MIKTVLFDLDGTLLNTIDDLADAGNWVCTQNGWPTFTVEQFKHMVGNGIPKLVERFSPEDARSQEQLAATLAQFSARYDAHKEDKTAPYAGIPELLDTLRANGIQCAVFSNKADAFCGKIIDHYFGTGRFDAVRGSRPGVPTKPDPAGLYALMEQIHADPAATLFVGDSDVITYGVQMLIAYMLSGPFIGFLFVNMNCMQSVGRALPATVLSVLRQGLLLIPLLYLLDAVFGLNGAVLGQSITDYVTIALSCVVWRRIRRGLEPRT